MNKYAILFGILLVGLSFAQPAPSGIGWNVYVQTCCQYRYVDSLLQYGYNYYALYDNSCETSYKGFMSESNRIGMIMFGGFIPNGLDRYYYDMENACAKGEGTQECLAAKQSFYARAAFARASFNDAKIYYYVETAQALKDNKKYDKDCSTTRATTLLAFPYAMDAYNRCKADPEDACFRVT